MLLTRFDGQLRVIPFRPHDFAPMQQEAVSLWRAVHNDAAPMVLHSILVIGADVISHSWGLCDFPHLPKLIPSHCFRAPT